MSADKQLQEERFESKRTLWPFLKRIFTYAFQFKSWSIKLIIFIVIVSAMDAAFPLIWLHFLDNVVTPMVLEYKAGLESGNPVDIDLSGLIRFGWIYAAVTVVLGIGVFAFIVYAGRIQEHVMFKLRREMFDKLQHLSLSFYNRSAIGWLLSRITSDTDRVSELVSWGFIELIWGIVMIIACITAMFFYNWVLALAVLLTIPLLLILGIRIRLLILKYSREARRLNSELTASFNEHINGVEVNKATSQEQRAAAEFMTLTSKMQRSSYKASYFTAMFTPVVIGVGSIAAAVVVFSGGNMVLEQKYGITIGIFAAFFVYARNIFEPIFDITRFYALAQGSLSAGERIFSLIDEKLEISDKEGVEHFNSISGNIEFEKVNFSYVEGKSILKDFNLKVKAGESIALVGPTGEGKSTIINLICRFYEPNSGKILIDGTDYRDKTLASFRKQLGIILQTPHLFSGSIKENILYGNLNASNEDVVNALKLIGADHFVDKLEEEVGEEGGNLSIGEKQLLAFARVILKDPAILILDEATSSVDTITEKKIQHGFDKLVNGRTAIVIAHRLSTIRNCDRILVIKKGSIIEEGSHEQLLNLKGHYYHLYTRQKRQNKESA
ncbi:MAG: ABC transporter ATP-binding protein [Chitinophagales bacterium]|nr:ABC transporter ATP-binding protein [Chitinophagales bacterium]